MLIDNQNLAETWEWSRREHNLTILNGSLQIHFNPKLCPREIDELADVALPAGRRANVSQSSNGEKVLHVLLSLSLSLSLLSVCFSSAFPFETFRPPTGSRVRWRCDSLISKGMEGGGRFEGIF